MITTAHPATSPAATLAATSTVCTVFDGAADALGELLAQYDRWAAERAQLCEAEDHAAASANAWAASDGAAVDLLDDFVDYLTPPHPGPRTIGQEQ